MLFLASVAFAPLWGQAEAGGGDEQNNRITEIVVVGLRRTTLKTALAPLEKFRGQDSRVVNLNDVRAAVVDTGILDPSNVEIISSDGAAGGGKTLLVTVQDKWALFPVPLIMWGSDGFAIGGALYNANAFGINDKMAFAGAYGNEFWFINLLYVHAGSKGLPGIAVNTGYSDDTPKHEDQDENVYLLYKKSSAYASLSANYQFAEKLRGDLRIGFSDSWIVPYEDAIMPPAAGRVSFSIQPEAQWRETDWDGKLLSERSVRLQYHCEIGVDSPTLHSVGGRVTWEKSIVEGFRFIGKAGARYSPWAPVEEEVSQQAAAVEILSGDFAARSWAGAQAGFEKALFSMKFGTCSALASYQIAYSNGSALGDQVDHGIAAAVRFYMRQLAIPALGLRVSYNVAANHFQWAFNMGMGM
jgi:hypothetical protein